MTDQPSTQERCEFTEEERAWGMGADQPSTQEGWREPVPLDDERERLRERLTQLTTREAEKALETAWELVKEQVEFSWHGNGCATHVGPEDGGGYCTPNCRQYQALDALRSLRTQHTRSRGALEKIASMSPSTGNQGWQIAVEIAREALEAKDD